MEPLNQSEIFKAMADPNRAQILTWLCSCPCPQSVSEVGDGCGCDIDFSVLSRHLAQLKRAGILSAEKLGRQVQYSVNAGPMAQLFRDLADQLESCSCCGAPADPKDASTKPN